MKSPEQFDIIGHVLDTRVLEIFHWRIPLPNLHLFGYDISITKHVVMVWLVSALMGVLFISAARKKSRVPTGYRNAVEACLVFIRDAIAGEQIGTRGIIYVPFLATLFFFILFCNLVGMVPFHSTATSSITVTASLAFVSFLFIHISGMREHGFLGYFKSIVPPVPGWLAIPMFIIEVVGHASKPFSLAIRLFANLTAGHIVLMVLMSIIFVFKNYFVAMGSIGAAVAVSCLEILVAFIQAFVFTYLTAVFIGMAVAKEH